MTTIASRIAALATIAAMASVLSCCTKRAVDSADIRIGVISMLSGEGARPNGRDLGRAARLAADEANAGGGLRVGAARRKVVILEEDDRSSPDAALEAARRLINSERVVALVGPQFSTNAIPAARLAEQQRIPMICPLSTHPDTTADKRYVFRIPYVDTFQGAVLARFASDALGASRAAVLFDVSSVYNKTLAEVFQRTFTAMGGTIVAWEPYTTDNNTDFVPQLRRIAQAAPDLLFLPNYADDVLLQARQAGALGLDATLLGGDGWDGPAFASEPAFEGSYYTTPWYADEGTAKSQAFGAAFRRVYGEAPTEVGATAYDAVTLIFAAIENARRADPQAIRDALAAMVAFPGVTGTISYRSGGDPRKSATVVRIQGGAALVFTVVQPEGGTP